MHQLPKDPKRKLERKCSEQMFSDQVISECDKVVSGDTMSHLTLCQYESMNKEEKLRLHTRVRQWAMKIKDYLPRDHGLYCLITNHLLRNAHREFKMSSPSDLQEFLMKCRDFSDDSRNKSAK